VDEGHPEEEQKLSYLQNHPMFHLPERNEPMPISQQQQWPPNLALQVHQTRGLIQDLTPNPF
jgi:hypothetical protein